MKLIISLICIACLSSCTVQPAKKLTIEVPTSEPIVVYARLYDACSNENLAINVTKRASISKERVTCDANFNPCRSTGRYHGYFYHPYYTFKEQVDLSKTITPDFDYLTMLNTKDLYSSSLKDDKLLKFAGLHNEYSSPHSLPEMITHHLYDIRQYVKNMQDKGLVVPQTQFDFAGKLKGRALSMLNEREAFYIKCGASKMSFVSRDLQIHELNRAYARITNLMPGDHKVNTVGLSSKIVEIKKKLKGPLDLRYSSNYRQYFPNKGDFDEAQNQFIIGYLSRPGRRENEDWFRKAAKQGSLNGMLALGVHVRSYYWQKELAQYMESFQWFNESARRNFVPARIALGCITKQFIPPSTELLLRLSPFYTKPREYAYVGSSDEHYYVVEQDDGGPRIQKRHFLLDIKHFKLNVDIDFQFGSGQWQMIKPSQIEIRPFEYTELSIQTFLANKRVFGNWVSYLGSSQKHHHFMTNIRGTRAFEGNHFKLKKTDFALTIDSFELATQKSAWVETNIFVVKP